MSREQQEYAARDAWAGLLIYLKVFDSPDRTFSGPSPVVSEPVQEQVFEPSVVDSLDSSADSLYRQLIEAENGNVTVKLDSLHAIMRVELPKKHPVSGVFAKKLRDAIFVLDPNDVKRVDEYLRRYKNTTFAEELLRNPDWCLKRVRRYIPPPEELYERVNEVFVEFCKESYKDERGVPLLSVKARKDMKTLLNDHIRKGCLSDPRNLALYTKIGEDKNGLPLYATFRGTSDVESLHQLLEQIFSSMNCSIEFMDAAISQVRHVFNIRASERHRPGFPTLGHYEHLLIDQINEITQRIYGKPIHKWWTVRSFFSTSTESFGVVPFLPESDWECVSEDAVKSYPRNYRYIAQRTKCLVPYLPVHTPEEWSLFSKNVSFFVGKGGGFKEMARCWNAGTLPIGGRAPFISNEGIICKKFETHLEDAHKIFMKRMKRKDLMNSNKNGMHSLEESLASFSEVDVPFLNEYDGAELGPFRVIFEESTPDCDTVSDIESFITANEDSPVDTEQSAEPESSNTIPPVLQTAIDKSLQQLSVFFQRLRIQYQ
ncbi:hypothetical protein BCR33DRAFT_57531 [Rhizoclosmatium globosum]|uniref:Uncharacterized protein n=1 Tax=Rhizoclosmatium globosum TaxID=329046 RepID=A0A1Y2CM67_9FUNG|nr:hypothetical protein BCR33DRAFT_57531 [Rhizoclosmatium globosum]|eukprot:ORY48047.1 hypothetical protein BCR33DRAFT_57531 [Rhizoclosmatium globosum]